MWALTAFQGKFSGRARLLIAPRGLQPVWQLCSQGTEGHVMAIYQHIRHPRIASRRADRPIK